ncbi:MAG: hypothetical protein IPH88_16730 [Bacteroidales bacterium]|nr:hypothetical protein [Bacteroidales bacterium]
MCCNSGYYGKETSAKPIEIAKEFRADHPFLFVIRDNKNGSILFMGKMMNPIRA